MILRLKREKPHWGARKIRELLVRRLNGDVRVPAKSTVHAVLDRHGLVKRARHRRRFTAEGTALSTAIAPNDLWCADFKGEFKLGNGRYCYPLTVTDLRSPRDDEDRRRLQSLPASLRRARPAERHPQRQRPAFCLSQRALQSLKAVGVVAQAGHRPGAHPARPSATEWPP